MVLFQTSSPCDDCVPEGVNLPCIFFQKNGFAANLRRSVGDRARLLVIAADPDSYELNDEMTATFAGCFEHCGVHMSEVQLLDARSQDAARELVQNSDAIILGGGHVPTQNRFFERIGLKWLLKDYPGTVMGISAGSMNCASIVYAQPEMEGESIDPDYRRFIPGLALTDVMILPHYQKVRHYILDGRRLYEDITYADSHGHNFIAVPDGSYVVTANGVSTLFGEGYLITDGRIKRICREENCIQL